jgi:hypothetical protein
MKNSEVSNSTEPATFGNAGLAEVFKKSLAKIILFSFIIIGGGYTVYDLIIDPLIMGYNAAGIKGLLVVVGVLVVMGILVVFIFKLIIWAIDILVRD